MSSSPRPEPAGARADRAAPQGDSRADRAAPPSDSRADRAAPPSDSRGTRAASPAAPSNRRPRQLLARLSLRTRLLAALIGLLAVVCLLVGVGTEAALYRFLVGQLDAQLSTAADRSASAFARSSDLSPPDDRDRPGPGFLRVPGHPVGTLGARLVDGGVAEAAVLDREGSPNPVPAAETGILSRIPADGRPHTRDLGDLGRYRLIAVRAPDGDTLVTGLPLSYADATLYRLAAVEAVVAGVGLLVAGFAGAWIVRLTLRPLRRVAATASRVAELPLDRGEVALPQRVSDVDDDPRTEVGQVATAFNRMLGHVAAALEARHASETQVRQFVADASHELRTPLAAIRGYTELSRRDREGAPERLVHALDRVESAAGRMTALVEDMLLLARLDAGRPLVHEPVDLSMLVIEAVTDAHVAGPNHRWHLELPDDAVQVPGDPIRLHQVLANLLANARTHTPPGTTVTVRLEQAGDAAVLRVTDDGPGIPAPLQPHVFERFARGDTSRSRAAGSSGLGLAIVHAVVTAHHGSVEVTSRPGRTEFAIRLPADDVRRPVAASGDVDGTGDICGPVAGTGDIQGRAPDSQAGHSGAIHR